MCGPELDVYIDENPGVVPMFDTMIFSSSRGTMERTTCSTWLTTWSVISSRVPVGALRLITNWAGSVRGKYDLPTSGYKPRLRMKMPVIPTTVASGRSNATPSAPS